jgi:antitoxin MazE
MEARIGRWGHSLAMRIPHAIAREAHLQEGTPVELTLADGRLVVTPLRRKYDLAHLVAGITPENRHAETDWGPPAGRESW